MYRAARKSDALLTGAPLPTLFYFALPIILGNIFQQLYSIVDAIVVGKFLGDLPLAGISVAAPIVDVANALVIGGTIGIGVLCAQMCGAEDWMRLRCMNATALLGGAALTMVIAAVGIVCSVPILRAQGTEEAVCREAAVYLQLVFAGLICCFLYNYYASMLRSCGNSRTPFVILLVSSTLHALLDVLFVGVLAWGIRGVACSTVLCQAFSAAWCILYAERRCPPLTLKRSELRFERRMGGMVLSYAWAAALQQAVVCIGRLLVQGMLTPLGTNTVTGYNMSLRIEQFLFCFSQGVSAAMVVCLSQNLGHGDRARVQRFYRVSVCVEAALIAVLGTVCFLFPSQIVGLFSDNGEVIAAGARYTGTMAYLYLFAYMGEVIQGFFRGLGRLRYFLIYTLSDENFSLSSTVEPPEDTDPTLFYFAMSLLTWLYWVAFSMLGGLIGGLITFDITGIDFALTALFVVLFIEQVIKRENRPAGFMGLACSVAGLAVFGADSMVIPAMALTLIALLLGRKKLCA